MYIQSSINQWIDMAVKRQGSSQSSITQVHIQVHRPINR